MDGGGGMDKNEGGGGGESIYDQLRNLPKIRPLLKRHLMMMHQESSSSSISLSPLSALSTALSQSSSSEILDQNLDVLDERSLVDICAEFQTFAMQQSRGISVRQHAVQNRLQVTDLECGTLVNELTQRNEQLKKLNVALRDAERLNRSIVQCQQGVLVLMGRLEELEHLLPEHVKKQVQPPLFAAAAPTVVERDGDGDGQQVVVK